MPANPLTLLGRGGRRLSGKALVRATRLALVVVTFVANAGGAIVVFVLAAVVLPGLDTSDESLARLVNAIAAPVFLILAASLGFMLGERYAAPVVAWLRDDDRPPTEKEQRRALRAPLVVLLINASFWCLAAVVFAGFNVVFGVGLAWRVGLVVGLGGVTTSAIAYLLAERVGRPIAIRALAVGTPPKFAAPGVAVRFFLSWSLGTAVPVVGIVLIGIVELSDRKASQQELALTMVALGGVALLVGLLAVAVVIRAVHGPLGAVGDALRKVEQGEFDVSVRVDDGSELGRLQAGVNRMASGLREREKLRDLFGRHVGEDVAQAALERGVELGGETQDVAVLFVDVIGSTALASEREPQEVVDVLNRFFDVAVAVVDEHGGWINKFEGDAALAIFGAPVPLDDRDTKALRCARVLGERLEREVSDVGAGVGVSAGVAVAGNIGSTERFEYTVIGDPVNEAARLSELAKELGGVVANARLVDGASENEAACWSLGDEVELRGRPVPTRIATPVRARERSGVSA